MASSADPPGRFSRGLGAFCSVTSERLFAAYFYRLHVRSYQDAFPHIAAAIAAADHRVGTRAQRQLLSEKVPSLPTVESVISVRLSERKVTGTGVP